MTDFFAALFTQPVPRLGFAVRRAGRLEYIFPPATFSMTPRERRLESYRRYRDSAKGVFRTRRYNASAKHAACCRRYREWHPRTEASYQVQNARCGSLSWVNPLKIDPQTGKLA